MRKMLHEGSRGSVLMEFIIVCPLMLILISAILQFAHIWIAREITAYAAFCAARAVLTAQAGEQNNAAQCAAEMACSWMALAGLSTTTVSEGETEEVDVGYDKLYETSDSTGANDGNVTVSSDNGERVVGELEIPGWGTIPGSDSVRKRVQTKVLKSGGTDGCACVAVRFKFPLLMPLVGRMISWTANVAEGDREETDYGFHNVEGGHDGWKGEHMAMDDDGELIDRTDEEWGEGGKFPVLLLTEACVLPMSYTGANLRSGVYNKLNVPGYGE